MKKILLLTVLCCLAALLKAQKIQYGVKVDAGFSNQYDSNNDIISTYYSKTFNITAVAEIPFKNNFWLQTGLGLNNKGGVIIEDALTTTTRITYLTVPLTVMRKFKFPGLGKFYAGAGWYVSRGMSGNFDYETPNSTSNDYIKFGNDNDFRRFDTGANFITGLELQNKLTFNLGYALGVSNIASQTQIDTGTGSVKNRLFTIGLGYIFSL